MKVFEAIDIGPIRDNQEDSMLIGKNLFVVSDGMGGHAAGELASKTVIDSFKSISENALESMTLTHILNEMNDSAVSANIKCLEERDGRGATCTAIYLIKNISEDYVCLYIHVGDSRLYHVRGESARKITEDHGRGHVLYNCVGLKNMHVDRNYFPVKAGDIFVLCSDGVSDVLDELDIAKIISESESPANDLIRKAISEGTEDNCTAIVIKL